MVDTKQAAAAAKTEIWINPKDSDMIEELIIKTPKERKIWKPSLYYAMDHQTIS
jgi:hypothetical protein